jgi:hypothetical protein
MSKLCAQHEGELATRASAVFDLSDMLGRWLGAVASLVLALGSTAVAAGVLAGTDGNDVLVGTADDDTIYGREGNDSLAGGRGSDELDGGPGEDDIRGGDDADVALYSGSENITVTLDDQRNDGAQGERDNVHRDVEDVYTEAGDDELRGSAARNTLDAGAGADRLTGGPGADFLLAGPGNDVVDARDGEPDVVDCGAGKEDLLAADTADEANGCEIEVSRLPRPGHVLAVYDGGFSPGSVPASRGCRGRARVRFSRAGRVLATKHVPVNGRCEVHASAELRASQVGDAKRITAVMRFLGHSDLGPRTFDPAPARIVRVEPRGDQPR